MTNSQMIEGRFVRWAAYRRAERFIRENAGKGHTLLIQNYGVCAAIKITAKTAELVFARKNGLFVQRGNRAICVWDRAVSCQISAN